MSHEERTRDQLVEEIASLQKMLEDQAAEFLYAFASWAHKARLPLSIIKGYADVLVNDKLGRLTDEQRQAMAVIERCCRSAQANWDEPLTYLHLRYGPKGEKWEAVALSDAVTEALNNLQKSARVDAVRIVLPNDLPPVKSCGRLATAIANLIAPDDYVQDLKPSLQASLIEGPAVLVQVHTKLKRKLRQKQLTPEALDPGTPLAVAALIIQRHGSQLQVRSSEGGTEFRFVLPVWDADASR